MLKKSSTRIVYDGGNTEVVYPCCFGPGISRERLMRSSPLSVCVSMGIIFDMQEPVSEGKFTPKTV
jgi:hypothetical protein